MPTLDALANIFDTYHLVSASVEFKSSVATVNSGKVVAGIDYNPDTPLSTGQEVASLTGSTTENVYKDFRIRVDKQKAQKQRLMSTASSASNKFAKTAFTIYTDVSGTDAAVTVVGSLWVHYVIILESVNPRNAAILAGALASTSLVKVPVGAGHVAAADPPVVQNQENTITFGDGIHIEKESDDTVIQQTNPIPRSEFGADKSQLSIIAAVDSGALPDSLLFAVEPKSSVRFIYTDGTAVEPGSIKQFPFPNTRAFMPTTQVQFVGPEDDHGYHIVGGVVTDLLGGIFRVVKPLLKDIPIIGQILTVISPDTGFLHEKHLLGDVESYPVVAPIICACAPGDKITVQLPETLTRSTLENVAGMFVFGFEVVNISGGTGLWQASKIFGQDPLDNPSYKVTSDGSYNTGGASTVLPTFVKFEPLGEDDAFRKGDMFSVNAFFSMVAGDLDAADFETTSMNDDASMTNLNAIDLQGDAPTRYGRIMAIIRESDNLINMNFNSGVNQLVSTVNSYIATHPTATSVKGFLSVSINRVSTAEAVSNTAPVDFARNRRVVKLQL